MLQWDLFFFIITVLSCGYPGAPAHSSLTFSAQKLGPNVVATYACERGFELLGPARRVCQEDGKWAPEGIPFCGKLYFNYLWFLKIHKHYGCKFINFLAYFTRIMKYSSSAFLQKLT